MFIEATFNRAGVANLIRSTIDNLVARNPLVLCGMDPLAEFIVSSIEPTRPSSWRMSNAFVIGPNATVNVPSNDTTPLAMGLATAAVRRKAVASINVEATLSSARRNTFIASNLASPALGRFTLMATILIDVALDVPSQTITLSISSPDLQAQLMSFGVSGAQVMLPITIPLTLTDLLGTVSGFVPPRLINVGLFVPNSDALTLRLEFDPLDARNGRSAAQRATSIIAGWNEFYTNGSSLIPMAIRNTGDPRAAVALSDEVFQRAFTNMIATSTSGRSIVSRDPFIEMSRADSPIRFERRSSRFRTEVDLWMHGACLPFRTDLAVTVSIDIVLTVRAGQLTIDAFIDGWAQAGSLVLCSLLNTIIGAWAVAIAYLPVLAIVAMIAALFGGSIPGQVAESGFYGSLITGAVVGFVATAIIVPRVVGDQITANAPTVFANTGLRQVPNEPRHFQQRIPLPSTSFGSTGASLRFRELEPVGGGIALIARVDAPAGRGQLRCIRQTTPALGSGAAGPVFEWVTRLPPIERDCSETIAVPTHVIRCENSGSRSLLLCAPVLLAPFLGTPGMTTTVEVDDPAGSGTVPAPASWMIDGVPPGREFSIVVRATLGSLPPSIDLSRPVRILVRSSDGARIITAGALTTLPIPPSIEDLVMQCQLARSTGRRPNARGTGRNLDAIFRLPPNRPDPRPFARAIAALPNRDAAARRTDQWMALSPGAAGAVGGVSTEAAEGYEWTAPIARTRALPGFSARS